MIHSMTAFASRTGSLGSISWVWEMRGVNARGLDLRLRLPDGVDGLEAHLRKALAARLSRGNVTVGLRINRDSTESGLAVDETHLDVVLAALDQIQERAFEKGVTLGQPTAADVLAQKGVLVAQQDASDDGALAEALFADVAALIDDFMAMRASEGAALDQVIGEQLEHIGALTQQAEDAAAQRAPQMKTALTTALRRVLEDVSEIDDARIAQELALLAVKSDITEEIDRLKAHVAAGQALLGSQKPAGRKLDFLAQEFNREANTLCSKAQSRELTAIGLELKAVIDQMREQIQNVE